MRWALVVVLCLGLGLVGVPGGDPVAAEALWAHAVATAGADRTAPIYVDACRELSRIRPWQPGYSAARRRMASVEAARRARLRW